MYINGRSGVRRFLSRRTSSENGPHNSTFSGQICAKPKRFGFYSTIYQSGPSGRVNGKRVLNERLGQVDSQPVFMTPTVAS